jgi:hypothetical protein
MEIDATATPTPTSAGAISITSTMCPDAIATTSLTRGRSGLRFRTTTGATVSTAAAASAAGTPVVGSLVAAHISVHNE